MASETNGSDGRGDIPSPRSKARGCSFNHDATRIGNVPPQADSLKKRLNVDSPSFTPTAPALSNAISGSKSATISPKAAFATPFTPKNSSKSGTSTPSVFRPQNTSSEWSVQDFTEFVPRSLDHGPLGDHSSAGSYQSYEAYNPSGAVLEVPTIGLNSQINAYAQDPSSIGSTTYYSNQNSYVQPPQYHLYAPLGPHRENLLAFQRTAHDFFIPDDLREELQRKSEATLQIIPNSSLPSALEYFHSLVPLDTNNQKSASIFGYPSWIYKAVSKKDGYIYALRRLEGFKLTNEKAIVSIKAWKRIDNGGVVLIHDAFTTGVFGDRSLIVVTDYHPLSKTLAEQHFAHNTRFSGSRANSILTPEQVLWGYLVQIGSALKAIHGAGLAARLISPSKIILTSKNRVRLNGCGVMDVVQFDQPRTLQDLQQDDLTQLGRLILSIATNNVNAAQNAQRALDLMSRTYSVRLKDTVAWLLGLSSTTPSPRTTETFLTNITDQIVTTLDNMLHNTDTLLSHLNRELENSRLVRLLTKLSLITERPDYDAQRSWSETGERYYLKLFRDYVFHQVDAEGRPVVDLGFIVSALNKLDAGSEEKICLVSRDEQNVFVVSFREVKRGVESAFLELLKAGRRA